MNAFAHVIWRPLIRDLTPHANVSVLIVAVTYARLSIRRRFRGRRGQANNRIHRFGLFWELLVR